MLSLQREKPKPFLYTGFAAVLLNRNYRALFPVIQ
jgi:hypothetical protein